MYGSWVFKTGCFPLHFPLIFPKQTALSTTCKPSTSSNTAISSIQKMAEVITSAPVVQSKHFLDGVPVAALGPPAITLPTTPEIAFLPTSLSAPFSTIRQLFDHLRSNPHLAASLNATYPLRGVFKTAATSNPLSDQKLTLDLSPSRIARIPCTLTEELDGVGLSEIVKFFEGVVSKHFEPVMEALSAAIPGMSGLAGRHDLLKATHRERNINFRLCDYTPSTADPVSENGCGAHRDYGTFSIIFQDGTPGLEVEDETYPGGWRAIPGDSTVVLGGWCAYILSGGELRAVRHRVRRTPGVRRLSAVLFVAPDLDVVLKPLVCTAQVQKRFSKTVMEGGIDVAWFKEVMGKRWRWREGNEVLGDGEKLTQDEEIEKLIRG